MLVETMRYEIQGLVIRRQKPKTKLQVSKADQPDKPERDVCSMDGNETTKSSKVLSDPVFFYTRRSGATPPPSSSCGGHFCEKYYVGFFVTVADLEDEIKGSGNKIINKY